MAYGFKITGIENIQRAFNEKQKEIKGVFKKDMESGADKIVSSAKSKAPKGATHNLEAAINKNEFWDKNGKMSIYVGIQINEVFTKADGWYARMQEKGTSKMRAHPYLRPAFNENKASINNAIVEDLKGILR